MNAMNRKVLAGAWIVGAIATAAVTTLATYSGPWKRPPNALDEIAEHSAALSGLSERARSESETVKNARDPAFDGLTQIVREIETQRDGLRQLPTSELGEATRLQGRMRASIMTATNLSEQIERFKSEYAVTHNVSRFVPTLAEKAQRAARTQGREALALQIERASQEAEMLKRTHREEDADALNATISAIESAARDEPPELQRTLYELAMQGRILAAKLITTERLFKQVTRGALGERAAGLAKETQAMKAEQDAGVARHWATVAAGGCASSALAWLGVRTLRKRRREPERPAQGSEQLNTHGSTQGPTEPASIAGLRGSAPRAKARSPAAERAHVNGRRGIRGPSGLR